MRLVATSARVVLTVDADNLPAVSLYRRHNLEVTATFDDKVAMDRRPA